MVLVRVKGQRAIVRNWDFQKGMSIAAPVGAPTRVLLPNRAEIYNRGRKFPSPIKFKASIGAVLMCMCFLSRAFTRFPKAFFSPKAASLIGNSRTFYNHEIFVIF